MTAVSRGACEAGGRVVGVTCDLFSRLTPNTWLTEERRTATLVDRLKVLTFDADAYLTLRGSIGTLSELTLAWSLIYTGSVPPRPLVLVGEPYRRLLDAVAESTYLREQERALVQVVDTVEEAVAALRAHVALQPPDLRG
jgi:predicted Rossmann-fold nucleotide-binding protein